MIEKPALVAKDLRKAYGATQALDGVSLEIGAGEVHAFLGGNGSGKSTAIKLLAGVVQADAGELLIGEESVAAKDMTPGLAQALGLRFVHQQPPVFPMETIAENIALGFEFPRRRGGPIRWREVRERAEVAVERFGLDLDVMEPMSRLRPANQAMIAIVRALQDLHELSKAVLILDEPTAALPRDEAQTLLDAVREYAAQGLAVLFVTHRLEEVLQSADRATVLKDGKVTGVLARPISRTTVWSRRSSARPSRTAAPRDGRPPRTPVRDSPSTRSSPDRSPARPSTSPRARWSASPAYWGPDAHLSCGPSSASTPAGAGPSASTASRSSSRPRRPRSMRASPTSPRIARSTPSSTGLSVNENISMVATDDYWRSGWLRTRQEKQDARSLMGDFGIKAAGEQALIGSLSGGNQQKVVLGRWIRKPVKVLLLDEPTQGVDVGARAEIFAAINRAAADGTAVVMVSSEFEELTLMCSRILVLRDGYIGAEITEPSSDAMELERAVHEGKKQESPTQNG